LRVAISVSDAARVGMHSDEVTVSLATVRELVDEQFPEWRGLPVWEPSSQGAVNAIVRIGEQFAARFPLLPEDLAVKRRELETEAEAARELLGRTPFRTPEPIALDEPGAGFPMPGAGAATRVPRRPRVGARQGVGVRAGDGARLVLRREQPGHEPHGTSHFGAHPELGVSRFSPRDGR
jgi:hypothetical protein